MPKYPVDVAKMQKINPPNLPHFTHSLHCSGPSATVRRRPNFSNFGPWRCWTGWSPAKAPGRPDGVLKKPWGFLRGKPKQLTGIELVVTLWRLTWFWSFLSPLQVTSRIWTLAIWGGGQAKITPRTLFSFKRYVNWMNFIRFLGFICWFVCFSCDWN